MDKKSNGKFFKVFNLNVEICVKNSVKNIGGHDI